VIIVEERRADGLRNLQPDLPGMIITTGLMRMPLSEALDRLDRIRRCLMAQ
jgi:hypothetical protein